MRSEPGKIPELLAPAGSFEKLVTAVHYGPMPSIWPAGGSASGPGPAILTGRNSGRRLRTNW